MEEREPPTSRQSNPEQPGPWMAESPRPSHSSPPPQTLTPVQSIQNNEDDQDFYKIPEQETQQRKGCLKKLKRKLKSVWATRLTLESDDKKLQVRTTLKELVVYILFLVLLSIVAFGMTSTSMFYVTKVMSELFLDSNSGSVSFRSIGSVGDTWTYLQGILPSALHWNLWYNHSLSSSFVFYENKLLGLPRIRQLKVRNNSCVVHEYFRDVIYDCYGEYSESNEDRNSKDDVDNYTAFTYQSEASLDGSSSEGKLASYSGGGFVQNLGTSKLQTTQILEHLFGNRWITRGTRALFIDFTVYNANVNLFCVVRLSVEFPATGGAMTSWSFRTVKLLRYVTVFEFFVLACEVFFVLFILYYIIEELLEISVIKLAYFKSVWNLLDIMVILISIVILVFDVYRTVTVDRKLQELTNKPDQFQDFDFISLWQIRFDNAIAITVFIAWVKLFKYVSFNKTMTQLTSTLARCAKDLAGFAVMYFIVFLAFTQLGYLLFGSKLKDFSDFTSSFFALFNIILGSFDFYALREVDPYLGPAFFMLFIFFIFFILVNMFLAIINDTYSEVKSELANQSDDFQISDYFLAKYRKTLGKIHAKEDRVLDLDDVLKYADANADGKIDFDEWRQDLIKRGYANGEIEALFCKYDADGSRYLDQEEQMRLRQDLEKQKEQINKDYDHLNENRDQASENDDSDNDSVTVGTAPRAARGAFSGVLYEEYTHLCRRVERMEHAVGGIIGKIDAVLSKLANLEKAKIRRRDAISKILNFISEGDNKDQVNKEMIESMLKQELTRQEGEETDTHQSEGSLPNSIRESPEVPCFTDNEEDKTYE